MADMAGDADPVGGFAALMNKAQEQADVEQAEAPYGYTTDPDGTERPKKAAGRPRKPPGVEELKAEAAGVEGMTTPDRAPEVKRTRLRSSKGGDPKPEAPAPQYRPGVITKGVNRLYRKAGKIVRAMDADVGEAIIQAARNTAEDDEPDDSVGAAWEELAKTNPRIRKFVMKLVTGGAWGNLLMAHAPIGMAIIMKPAILKHIPFQGLMASMAEADEDTPEGEGGLPGGMTADDAGQMAELAQAQFAKMGLSVPPEMAAQLAGMASGIVNGGGPVPKAVRNQPRRTSRADRHGGLRWPGRADPGDTAG